MKADIVFVIDASRSEGNDSFSMQITFVKDFVNQFRIGPKNYRYKFALVTYSYDVIVHFEFDTYQSNDKLLEALDNVHHDNSGATLTGKALSVTREQILIHARNNGTCIA